MADWTSFAAMAGLVVGGNAAIGLAFSRVHARVRSELARDEVLFQENAVRTKVESAGFLSWSVRWYHGDVVVTHRNAVSFARNLVIAQPPLRLARSADASPTGWGVANLVVERAPERVGESVRVFAVRGRATHTLTFTPRRPDALLSALEAWHAGSTRPGYRG